MGSFQACLDCRAGFVLQSSTGCACKHLSSLNMLASPWSVVSRQVECPERLHYKEVCYQKSLHLPYDIWNFPDTSAQEMQQAEQLTRHRQCSFPLLLPYNDCFPFSMEFCARDIGREKATLRRTFPAQARLRNSELFPGTHFTERLGTNLNPHTK